MFAKNTALVAVEPVLSVNQKYRLGMIFCAAANSPGSCTICDGLNPQNQALLAQLDVGLLSGLCQVPLICRVRPGQADTTAQWAVVNFNALTVCHNQN